MVTDMVLGVSRLEVNEGSVAGWVAGFPVRIVTLYLICKPLTPLDKTLVYAARGMGEGPWPMRGQALDPSIALPVGGFCPRLHCRLPRTVV